MGIDLPAVDPEQRSEDRPPTTVQYLDYLAVAKRDRTLGDDPFEKAADASLPLETFGTIEVPQDELKVVFDTVRSRNGFEPLSTRRKRRKGGPSITLRSGCFRVPRTPT